LSSPCIAARAVVDLFAEQLEDLRDVGDLALGLLRVMGEELAQLVALGLLLEAAEHPQHVLLHG